MATRIELVVGDIVTIETDALVNATNSTLFGGADDRIHSIGGPQLLSEIQRVREAQFTDGLPEGQAISTNAGNLPAKWVIHTVAPKYSADDDRSDTLGACYIAAMELADMLSAQSVTFTAIGTASDGWPLDDAARIAIEAVRSTDTHIGLVTFVLGSDAALAAFQHATLAAS